jgi:hypothetical protein
VCDDCGADTVLRQLEVPTHQDQVREMMQSLELLGPNKSGPRCDSINFELLRNLVSEEAAEFHDAMVLLEHAVGPCCGVDYLLYWADVIDAICDIEVVIHNTSNAMGIDIEPFFQEVHRANMAKAGGPVREDGKRLKPPGWVPPRIEEILEEVLEGRSDHDYNGDEPVG